MVSLAHLLIAVLILTIAVRSYTGCGALADGLVSQVQDAMSVREDAANVLKDGHVLYGAEWCRFTKLLYADLKGKFKDGAQWDLSNWEKDLKADFAKDPQVVNCDSADLQGHAKIVCANTGYPTVLSGVGADGKVSRDGAALDDDAKLKTLLAEGDSSKGVWLGYDKEAVKDFKA